MACASQVFGWTEEPKEADKAQVGDVGGAGFFAWIEGRESKGEMLDDGEICGVGSFSWVVFVGKGFEETNE